MLTKRNIRRKFLLSFLDTTPTLRQSRKVAKSLYGLAGPKETIPQHHHTRHNKSRLPELKHYT